MTGTTCAPAATVAWWVVVPVKGGSRAKSRLALPAGVDRRELARAIALDVVSAAVATVGAGHVVVVTSSRRVGAACRDDGAHWVPDPHAGLDAAVRAGGRYAAAHGAAAVAVLLGDVAAVRRVDLADALGAAATLPRAVVPDHAGTGTALLTAVSPADLRPAFGVGSAARHTAAGHARLDLPLPRLRTDVDDAQSLEAARALGLGRHSAAVLAGAG